MTDYSRTHPIRIIPPAHTAAEDRHERRPARAADASSRFRRLLESQAAARSARGLGSHGGVEGGADMAEAFGRPDMFDASDVFDASDKSDLGDTSDASNTPDASNRLNAPDGFSTIAAHNDTLRGAQNDAAKKEPDAKGQSEESSDRSSGTPQPASPIAAVADPAHGATGARLSSIRTLGRRADGGPGDKPKEADTDDDEYTASPRQRRLHVSGSGRPMPQSNTFAPPLAEQLARNIAVHCEAADVATDGVYEITIRIEPSVLPDTSLTLSASGSDLSLRFQSGEPRSVALLSEHADALQSRLARRIDRRVTMSIDINRFRLE